MKYLQLFEYKLDGSLDHLLGSDGVVHVDGRWNSDSIFNMFYHKPWWEASPRIEVRNAPDNRYTTSHLKYIIKRENV